MPQTPPSGVWRWKALLKYGGNYTDYTGQTAGDRRPKLENHYFKISFGLTFAYSFFMLLLKKKNVPISTAAYTFKKLGLRPFHKLLDKI